MKFPSCVLIGSASLEGWSKHRILLALPVPVGHPIEATQWLALKQCRSFDPKLIEESREVQGGAPWSANLLQFVV